MRRLFWASLGAAAGVAVVRKMSKTAQAYSPEGIGRGLSSLGDGLREFADVVREGMAERDAELRAALGVDAENSGAASAASMDADSARDLIDHPASPRH